MTDTTRAALAWALAGLLALAAHCCGHAHAQSDETLTARVCISETTLAAECRQISAATAERAVRRGRTYRAELRSYSPRATGVRPYVGREWIAELLPDVRPPMRGGEAIRLRFQRFMAVAWRAMRGIDPAPCPAATEWGARSCEACRRRMRAAGYRRAYCGLRNAWYRRVR